MTTSTAPTTDTPTSLDAITEDVVLDRSTAAGEPSWMTDRRLAAFKTWLDQDWPNRRADEYWRNTPFDRLVDVTLPLVEPVDAECVELAEGVVDTLESPAATVTVVDGAVLSIRVDEDWADRGLVVESLRDAAAGPCAGVVSEHLGSLTTTGTGSGRDEDRTISTNDALWDAGVFVHVPAELEVTAPIGIQTYATRPGVHLPRVLAVAEHHARVTLVLEHLGGDLPDAPRASRNKTPVLVDEVVEVIARDSSFVDVISVNEHGDDVAFLSLQKAGAHRDATVRHYSATLGGATVRLRPEVDLLGPGASAFPSGIYFADEGQHFDVQPYMRHIAPRATSDVLYKGALQGKSRAVFRGNVYVAREAVGTTTNENNRNLILTKGARADSTPFLEIECADITAGHGSATGQIDARHLFYLQARGLRREQALRLIVLGFFNEVLEQITLPSIGERTLAAIEREIDLADLDQVNVSAGRVDTPRD
ncbi:Fe-S cluster assembly protein SufD [Salsipaludibacter albus]|uniref:Fe-S cluster assembly protein SufD n=1 Tax=Salsipaludibacter albus TaxID=2849650 RepID=UPI001EE46FCD|nr:Fe-S cluster assembly protein SufD [Salsipaludibacter albus]MBY5164338.1 Fe-S cluster assembly protein SufD [Salsipaludibacter albus]